MEARQKGAEAVSTHSRPKAAGWIRKQQALALKRFNSQPPEGGWDDGEVVIVGQQFRFNSQPPEGGWRIQYFSIYNAAMFQLTAARRRLGARRTKSGARKSFQLTAARRRLVQPFDMSHNSAQAHAALLRDFVLARIASTIIICMVTQSQQHHFLA